MAFSFTRAKNKFSDATADVVMINLYFDSGTKICMRSEIINKIFSHVKNKIMM